MAFSKLQTQLKPMLDGLRWVGNKLNWFYTLLLLSMVYILIVGPMFLIAKLLRKDPLAKKNTPHLTTYWQERIISEQTLERQKHQF